MMYLGFVMIGIGLIVVIAGLLQRSKMKKILAAPFKKTGEIASNPSVADAKGVVSCEGAVTATQPIVAPCSNSQCVYYELKVEKQIEESKMTDKGLQTSKTWKNVSEQKQGSCFQVNDGSGVLNVDAREGIDADLKQSYSGAPPGGQGLGILANMLTGAIFGGNERILQYRATEKIIPAQGNLFVMGKLAGGQITKTDGMMGKLTLSTKGRDGLVGSVKTMSIILLAVGGLTGVGGIPVAIFGDKPKDVSCQKTITDDKASLEGPAGECKSALKQDTDEYTWKVTKPGVWEVRVVQPADATVKAHPRIFIFDSEKVDVGSYSDEGKASIGKVAAFKGEYKIKIDAAGAFDPAKLEGGFRYELQLKFIKKSLLDDETKKASADDESKDDKESDDKDDKKAEDDKPSPKKKGSKDDK